MIKYILLTLVILLALVVARLSIYTVDAAEYAYVTVLGRHVATFDGADAENGAGLKIGWPWPIQQVQRLDRRLQQFDLDPVELLTRDSAGKTIDKILLIEAYVCWKIASEEKVNDFVQSVGSTDRVKAILAPRVNSQIGAEIGQMQMDDLVNVPDGQENGLTRADVKTLELRNKLLDTLRPQVAGYGIELVDIRLRRFNHPASVRASIFSRIQSERKTKATKYKSDGERLAGDIISKAEAEVRENLAKARADEEKVKADADTEAMKIRNEAYSLDPEFYAFLKKMENLQNILGDKKTMLLLSTHRPLFESLFQPPRVKEEKKKG